MRYLLGLVALLMFSFGSAAAFAEAKGGAGVVKQTDAAIQALAAKIKDEIPALPLLDITASPIDGLYELTLTTGEYVLADKSGSHFVFGGQILKVDASGRMVNLTEQKQSQLRIERLKQADKSQMVIYEPEGESKGDLYVFTDVDCGYCQKFHQEVPALNKLGIRVKYLGWPRAGLNSGTAKKMVQIWCADDPQAAMDQAKTRRTIKSQKLCESAIPLHFDLGMKLGVKGTPAIYLSDGRQVGGYRSADELAKEIGL